MCEMTTCREQSRRGGEVACFTDTSRFRTNNWFRITPSRSPSPPVLPWVFLWVPQRFHGRDRPVRADLTETSLQTSLIRPSAPAPSGGAVSGVAFPLTRSRRGRNLQRRFTRH